MRRSRKNGLQLVAIGIAMFAFGFLVVMYSGPFILPWWPLPRWTIADPMIALGFVGMFVAAVGLLVAMGIFERDRNQKSVSS